jgi:hypothetical protein
VPVPCFLLFLRFRKVTQEIFSELDETKPEPPIFPGRMTKTEGELDGGQGPTTPGVVRVDPWACHPLVWRHWSTSDTALPPISSLRHENPKSFGNFPEEVPQLRCRHRRDSGDRSLCSGTLPRWGSAPGAISIDSIASTTVSIDFTAISIDVAVSHDEEGVGLPRGRGLYR